MYWLGRSADRTAVTQADLDTVFSALEVGLGCSLADRTQFLGERDLIFRARADQVSGISAVVSGQKVMVKILDPAWTGRDLDLQDQIAAALTEAQEDLPFAVPAAIVLPGGDEAGRAGRMSVDTTAGSLWVRIAQWLDGEPMAASGGCAADLYVQLGRATAQLHRALRGVDPQLCPREHDWTIFGADRRIEHSLQVLGDRVATEDRDIIRNFVQRFRAEVLPEWDALPAAVIHHDLHDGNTLLDTGGNLAGIIDFGDIATAPRIVDLSITASAVTTPRTSTAEVPELHDVIADLCRGYEDVGPLSAEEKTVIAPISVMRHCLVWTNWQRVLLEEDTPYARARSENLLEVLRRAVAETL